MEVYVEVKKTRKKLRTKELIPGMLIVDYEAKTGEMVGIEVLGAVNVECCDERGE